MSGKFRPHGHLGADTTKSAASRRVLRDHFGPYYIFVQRIGAMPVMYGIISLIVYRSWLYMLSALVYAFLFHVLAISYFAARSKIGLDTCPKGSFGWFWSWIFIPRAIFYHLAMLSVLIWVSPVWFLASGVILYAIDYIITIAITLKWSLPGKNEPADKPVRNEMEER